MHFGWQLKKKKKVYFYWFFKESQGNSMHFFCWKAWKFSHLHIWVVRWFITIITATNIRGSTFRIDTVVLANWQTFIFERIWSVSVATTYNGIVHFADLIFITCLLDRPFIHALLEIVSTAAAIVCFSLSIFHWNDDYLSFSIWKKNYLLALNNFRCFFFSFQFTWFQINNVHWRSVRFLFH